MRLRPLATVRARTVLGGSLALGIALVLSASTAGQLLRRSLIRSIDEVAEVRAAEVAGLPRGTELPDGLSSKDGEIVQVVGADGRVLATSIPAAATDRISQLMPPPGRFKAQTVDRLDGGIGSEGRYRLAALLVEGGPDSPIVYVATGLDSVDHHVAVLSRLVLVGLPALLGLVALSAWLAVGRALQPVEAIRSELADISASDLDRRVPESGAGDEVDRLAQTMNAMLDRLESSAERQRQFVSNASEELVAPLAATRNRLEAGLLAAPEGGWPATGADLLREHRRMERLVRDLLYLARVDAGAAPGAAGPRRPRRRRALGGHPRSGGRAGSASRRPPCRPPRSRAGPRTSAGRCATCSSTPNARRSRRFGSGCGRATTATSPSRWRTTASSSSPPSGTSCSSGSAACRRRRHHEPGKPARGSLWPSCGTSP